ncbi:MAG: peptidoglycan bridge formation glycyltransferase FemA/FemB family protein [Oscillospiraceae bacterium]
MYEFKIENDLNAFDEFVVANGGSFLQCSKWPKVKEAWSPLFYSGFFGEERVLTCLVLVRKLPGAGSIWYISCGTISDYNNEELQQEFAKFIKAEMKREKATCAIIDPLIPLRINGKDCEEGLKAHSVLTKCGYELNSNIETYTYKHPVQMFLKLKDENGQSIPCDKILRHCEKGVRYSVRIGTQRGLTTQMYKYEDIENNSRLLQDFMSVMHDTSDRNNFVERDSEYCKNLMSAFKENTDITIVYYDKELDEQLENQRQIKKKDAIKALETAPEKKIRGLKDEIEAIDKNTHSYEARMAETTEYPPNAKIPVAGGLTLRYAGVGSCLFGGTRNIVRNNTRSSHYLNYLRICKSIEEGCDIHDLGYVLVKSPKLTKDGTLGPLEPAENFVGISEFKKSFGADYYEFIGEYILVSDKFKYWLYSGLMPKAKKVKMKIVKSMRRMKGQ